MTELEFLKDLLGTKSDTLTVDPNTSSTEISILKGILKNLSDIKINTKNILSGVKIDTDKSITFANNALVSTIVNIDIVKPSIPLSEYMLTVYNPSSVTILTVTAYAKALNIGGADRYSLVGSWSFAPNSTQSKFVHGIFCGSDVRFEIKNETALGVADGFTATLRLREVI